MFALSLKMKLFVIVLLVVLPSLALAAAFMPASNYYGVDGFNVIGDTEQYPSYANVTVRSVDSTIKWADSTTDERALQKVFAPDRVAAAWSTFQSAFDVDIQITDGQTHQVALYFLDWDRQNRTQRLAVISMSEPNGTLVDYRLVSDFSGGVYYVYNISGRVIFRVWRESASDAVLSGIFFQPVGVPSATPSPSPTATPTPVPTPAPTPSATPCKFLPNGKCRKN